jgi:hypothetical protein
MSTDSRKTVEAPAQETQVSSGWDPFTVWRERVHKPRSKRAAPAVADATAPLAILLSIKQRG